MRYAQTFTANPTASAIWKNQFRANSVYDPDLTGTGHQPLGFDQWSPFYKHYKVLGAKITATVQNQGQTIGTSSGVVGIQLDATATDFAPDATLTTVMETPKTKWKTFTYAKSSAVVSKKFSAKRFFCRKSSDSFTARVNANPAEDAIFTVWIASADQSTDLEAVFVQVLITYIVMFFEPATMIAS